MKNLFLTPRDTAAVVVDPWSCLTSSSSAWVCYVALLVTWGLVSLSGRYMAQSRLTSGGEHLVKYCPACLALFKSCDV